MDLLKGIKVEEHTCRVCGRPCGLFDECDRCFLDRLESQFEELMDDAGKPALPDGLMDEVEWTDERPAEAEASAPPPAPAPVAESPPVPDPKPEPEPDPEPEDEPEAEAAPEPEPEAEPKPEPASAPPPVAAVPPPATVVRPPAPAANADEPASPERRRIRAGLLVAAALSTAAVAAAFVVLRDDSDGVSTAAPEPAPIAAPEPPPAPVIGDWRGKIAVRYESGFSDKLTQTISVDAVAEGEVAGFSRSRQNGGSCWGPLTFTGMRGDAYAFDYRERNTDECIARGKVTLTPRGEAAMDYREVTKSSVNRGVLIRQ